MIKEQFKETVINPSCRQKPASGAWNLLASGLRRNDEKPSLITVEYRWPYAEAGRPDRME